MWFMRGVEERIGAVEQNVSKSFDKVKSDVGALTQWIKYLSSQNKELSERLSGVQLRLQGSATKAELAAIPSGKLLARIADVEQRLAVLKRDLPLVAAHAVEQHMPSKQEVVSWVENSTSVSHLSTRLLAAEARLERLRESEVSVENLREVPAQLERLREQVQSLLVERPSVIGPAVVRSESRSRLQERVLRRVSTDGKDYMKDMILTQLRKTPNLRGQRLRERIVDEERLCSRSSFYRLLEELEAEGHVSFVVEGKHKVYVLRNPDLHTPQQKNI